MGGGNCLPSTEVQNPAALPRVIPSIFRGLWRILWLGQKEKTMAQLKAICWSLWLFVWGTARRFWWWLPTFLLMPMDLYEKFLSNYFQLKVEIPTGYFPYAFALGIIASAISTFHDLRSKYDKLQARELEIFFGDGEPFEQEGVVRDSHGNTGTTRLFRVGVRSKSGSTIERTQVKLEKIDPPVPNLHGVTLHVRHDNPADGIYKTDFPLDPEAPEYVDVVIKSEWGPQAAHPIQIYCIVQGVPNQLPPREYLLTLLAQGQDARSVRRNFVACVNPNGKLLFYPAA